MRNKRTFTLLAFTLLCVAQTGAMLAQTKKGGGSKASSDPGGHIQKGLALATAGQYEPAIAEYTAAIDAGAKAPLYIERGKVFRAAGRFPEAIGDYSEALKIKPDADTLERRAYALMQVKDYDHALGDYTEAIKLEPKNQKPYLLRSYILELKGDVKNGVADCDAVLKLEANNPEAMSRKMRLQKRAELANHPTPPPIPEGPIANPALKKASPSPAAATKP